MSKEMNEQLARIATGKYNWPEDARYRRENRAWLRKSGSIALKVLKELEQQGLTQKDLANRMKVSPQQVSKILSGRENITLETITKLETALGIVIIPSFRDNPPAA